MANWIWNKEETMSINTEKVDRFHIEQIDGTAQCYVNAHIGKDAWRVFAGTKPDCKFFIASNT